MFLLRISPVLAMCAVAPSPAAAASAHNTLPSYDFAMPRPPAIDMSAPAKPLKKPRAVKLDKLADDEVKRPIAILAPPSPTETRCLSGKAKIPGPPCLEPGYLPPTPGGDGRKRAIPYHQLPALPVR
ncbi:hypothetical protein [Chromobacterium sp. IIBBL 290-4]|uniref:hypothetical protein n=1 Tax=Chromobacterium sp. IIBBL 290-4 TaxID=2953890 RepID=UPI0020B88616|nr:hypothetical protein [Chromobacterium sp. IIBBL 290-4]UTH74913.1 hypothetical protein NKT35_02060 [Chromobacterium sp. IIBBL 290-4]